MDDQKLWDFGIEEENITVYARKWYDYQSLATTRLKIINRHPN